MTPILFDNVVPLSASETEVKLDYPILEYEGKKVDELKVVVPVPPPVKLSFTKMRDYIKTNFNKPKYVWTPLEIVNKCVKSTAAAPSDESETSANEDEADENVKDEHQGDDVENQGDDAENQGNDAENQGDDAENPEDAVTEILKKGTSQNAGSNSTLADFLPTQEFVRTFVTPASPYKGMLLWHSVGTGKTCTAVATASSSFVLQGYTILWVTRNTLKGDIWKNIFGQVCHAVLQDAVREGVDIPSITIDPNASEPVRRKLVSDELSQRKHLLSAIHKKYGSLWIEPMSYKTFSNVFDTNGNDVYRELAKRNQGKNDLFYKTLIIIDEAHKLYGGDLPAQERPDMEKMMDILQKSYATSGVDSARLLLMTATPMTNSPMELIQLVNLCKEKSKNELMPADLETFKKEYMTTGPDQMLSNAGIKRLANEMTGYISYLNREKDPSSFAQAKNIYVPVVMTHFDDPAVREAFMSGKKGTTTTSASATTLKKKQTELNKLCGKTGPYPPGKCSELNNEITQLKKDMPLAEIAKTGARGRKQPVDAALKLKMATAAEALLQEHMLVERCKNVAMATDQKK